MSSDIESWPPPNDANAFESLCLDLWREIWKDHRAQKNGRSGQPQAGVDVFGIHEGKQVGVQCKQKDGLLRSKLTVAELEHEVEEAKTFVPALSRFIVVTTGPRDARVQERARVLTEDHKQRGFFSVEVWSWNDIWPEIYQREELLNRIGPIYWRHTHRLTRESVGPKSRFAFAFLLLVAVSTFVVLLIKYRHGLPRTSATNVIPLPFIQIESLNGLPEGMTNNPKARLNRFTVRNGGEVQINNFCSRLQLPEAIATVLETNTAAGTTVGWKPLLGKLSVSGTGGRTEGGLWIGATSAVHFIETPECFLYPGKPRGQKLAISKRGDITGIWELTIDRLPPRGYVTFLFLTSNVDDATTYADLADVPLWQNTKSNPDTNELRFYFEGEYWTDLKPEKQTFFLPLSYDKDKRRISSSKTLSEPGLWRPVTLTLQ